jgi:hypothetical protein
VLVALLSAFDGVAAFIGKLSAEHALVRALGQKGFELVGVVFFVIMGTVLYRIARRPNEIETPHI